MNKWLLILCLAFLAACPKSGDIDKERFQVNNNGTILDTQTELLWADSDNGVSLNWFDAEAYCNDYTGGGYQDWRMPSQKELAGLFAADIRQDGPMFTINDQHLWAAETNDSRGGYCDFTSGRCSWMEKVISISMRILPVRDNKISAASEPPSAAPNTPQSVEQRLQVLDELLRQQLITTDEYNSKKAAILNEL